MSMIGHEKTLLDSTDQQPKSLKIIKYRLWGDSIVQYLWAKDLSQTALVWTRVLPLVALGKFLNL